MSTRTPTHDQILVALHALRDDADRWGRSSAALQEASSHVTGAALEAAEFSLLGQDMARAYAELRDRITGLLGAAATSHAAIAGALRHSADTYEREERANVHRLRHVY